MRAASIIEIVFSAIGAAIFFALWIYMLKFAMCYRSPYWIFLTEVFSFLGFVYCLVTLFHGCLEHIVTIGRGILGCFIFFQLIFVALLNIVDGFMAVNCLCQCKETQNAFTMNSVSDLTIMALSWAGSFCIIAIIFITSIAHR